MSLYKPGDVLVSKYHQYIREIIIIAVKSILTDDNKFIYKYSYKSTSSNKSFIDFEDFMDECYVLTPTIQIRI